MQQATTQDAKIYDTSIGKKAVMAVSGIVLLGFVLGHLLGNLQLYLGPEAINAYAAALRRVPGLLWGARAALLLAVGAHIWTSVQLAVANAEARPVRYRKRRDQATNYAARTMYWSGPILLFYIVYHLAHLTFGYTGGYPFDPENVYDNVVFGFQHWWISAVYIAGNLAVGVHLYHGAWSLFQSLGLNHARYASWRRPLATLVATFITVGNLSFPLAVLGGWVEPTTEMSAADIYPENVLEIEVDTET